MTTVHPIVYKLRSRMSEPICYLDFQLAQELLKIIQSRILSSATVNRDDPNFCLYEMSSKKNPYKQFFLEKSILDPDVLEYFHVILHQYGCKRIGRHIYFR
jgi:hypothetical protein